ncbi:MAG: hypothetical protein ACKVOK_03475 [Flavobacteriales bacterium]
MSSLPPYKPRSIRFLGIEKHDAWSVKVYSISNRREYISSDTLKEIRAHIPLWFELARKQTEHTYAVATLIAHEGREGNFAILSWWTEENMLRLYAYLAKTENTGKYELISDKGIVTCIWEMAVLWFERNAWVKFVLQDPDNPNSIHNYLEQHLNDDI